MVKTCHSLKGACNTARDGLDTLRLVSGIGMPLPIWSEGNPGIALPPQAPLATSDRWKTPCLCHRGQHHPESGRDDLEGITA